MAKIYPNNDSSGFYFLHCSSKQSLTVDLENWHWCWFTLLNLINKGRGHKASFKPIESIWCLSVRNCQAILKIILVLPKANLPSLHIWCVLKFSNPKVKSHQRCYPHMAQEELNLYPLATFQLNSVLRLETSAFWISKLWQCVT